MKLLRWGEKDKEKPGILDSKGQIRDLSQQLPDLKPSYLSEENINKIINLELESLPLVPKNARLGPCLGEVGKLVCIGLNSFLHVQEMGLTLPQNDIVFFMKATSAITGPSDPILYPRLGQKVDWEAELAIVIGKKCKYVTEEEALDYVLGYTCLNDLSDRYWQLEKQGGQFSKGKSFDTFAPLGPYLVTKEEIPDIRQLIIQLSVNGELRQAYTGADYIFDVKSCVSYLSQLFTLAPGDVISMGSGPGTARSYGNQYLKPGDVIELEIEQLGKQMNVIYLDE